MIEFLFAVVWIGGAFALSILAALIGHMALQYLGIIDTEGTGR